MTIQLTIKIEMNINNAQKNENKYGNVNNNKKEHEQYNK